LSIDSSTRSAGKRRIQPERGRPTAARVSEINRAILDAATRCFLANGYDAATMDAIAAAARVSKATLYARFSQKESLLHAVVEDRAAAWSAEASKRNWRLGDTLEQRLKHYVGIVMSWAMADEVRAFDRLLASTPVHVGRPLYELRYRAMVDLLTDEIEQFTRTDAQPAKNPRQVAIDLMALVTGWFRMETAMRTPSRRKAVEYGHHAVELLLAARAEW
jgi:AcrR family transcriptional regulator